MVGRQGPDTDALLAQASRGDRHARQTLLARHRGKLRKMVALRIDRRLASRVDPSDVVQDALTVASTRLSDYLQRRPIPFYPWLRQLAWERLIELHRQHIHASKRSVIRETPGFLELPDDSAMELAARLVVPGSTPSQRFIRDEMRERVRDALARLSPSDREVLVLRHLEQLTTREAAAVLGLSERAVKSRHVRSLERVRQLLIDERSEEP